MSAFEMVSEFGRMPTNPAAWLTAAAAYAYEHGLG